MEKAMKVCDACQKVLIGNPRTVVIDGTEYGEVCENCIGRLNTFMKRLSTPYTYKKKAKKTAVESAETTEPAPVIDEPKAEEKKGGFGRKK